MMQANTVVKSGSPLIAVERAAEYAREVRASQAYEEFVSTLRSRFPWRFQLGREVIERDYVSVVDHHLRKLIPQLQRYIRPGMRRVLDFGCGSGGSAIALALVYRDLHVCGTDIDADEISVAHERARLYNVEDRCEFHHVIAGRDLPYEAETFDLCQCSSVLEYVLQADVRQFCVREMVRNTAPGGLLVFSVPNRLYPFEIHTGKWGWNYFPGMTRAKIVDSTAWEVRRLAKPAKLSLFRTPLVQLFRPWSNFCLRKQGSSRAAPDRAAL